MGVICLVTIHGIGFEQPPLVNVPGYPDTPGYADRLHEHLLKYLDDRMLGDDPFLQQQGRAANGPIYVQSVWPPDSHNREAGLRRLGTWDEHGGRDKSRPYREVDASHAPLSDGIARIAHIALVYSQLEEHGRELGATGIALSMALGSVGHYANVSGLLHMLFSDVQPLLNHHAPASTLAQPGLRIRHDPGYKSHSSMHHFHKQAQLQPPSNSLSALIRQLEDDVASYVCRNEMRERVRNFVLDAILRLACREDVDGIVINSHSNGTVVAIDVLHNLPPFASKKVKALITAGSPLRKYIDFFTWGSYLATIPMIARWVNFYDERDPVGDPLAPSAGWRRGTQPADLTGLYKALDPTTGTISDIHIDDTLVDNITNSTRGELQAHNYWDNELEFVQPLAKLLQEVVWEDRQIPVTRELLPGRSPYIYPVSST